MEIAECWAYRARGTDPLVEVRLLKIGTRKPARVLVQFVADEYEGHQEWVSPARLKVLWSAAEEFAAREKRWDAICDGHQIRDTAEEYAAHVVFESLIDPAFAELVYRSPGVCRVRDVDSLSQFLDLKPDGLRHDALSFVDDGDLIVPWPVTENIGRRAAELNSGPILRYLQDEETRQHHKMVHGEWAKPTRRNPDGYYYDADFFAALEEEPHHRPCRDLLRQWCGVGAADRWDQLAGLRQEIHRLGLLAKDAIDALRKAGLQKEAARIERGLVVNVGELPDILRATSLTASIEADG